MASLKAKSIDLVVTFPPYNLGIHGKFADTADRNPISIGPKMGAQIRRLLRPNGSFFLNLGAAPQTRSSCELILRCVKVLRFAKTRFIGSIRCQTKMAGKFARVFPPITIPSAS
jgi:DNA modification methylase